MAFLSSSFRTKPARAAAAVVAEVVVGEGVEEADSRAVEEEAVVVDSRAEGEAEGA